MSLKQKTIFGFVLMLLSGVGSVLAAPAVVEEVTMILTQDGEVAVSWSPVTDAVSYNVYFSRQSILQNGGDYDDFESTTGNETTYVFSAPPVSGEKMFVAVLAMSDTGEESEGFVTEASIDLPEVMSSSSSSQEPEPTTTSEPLALRGVQAVSSTGVLLQFSKPLGTESIVTPAHFVMTDTGGTIIEITSVEMPSPDSLLLKTGVQQPTKKYILGLVQNLRAADGTVMTTSTPRILFDGFVGASQPDTPVYTRNPNVTSSEPTVPTPTFSGPSLAEATAEKQKDGSYTVRVSWTPAPNAVRYTLYTSADNAEFKKAGTATAMQSSARFRNVVTQKMYVKVTATNAEGIESAGVTREVLLTTGTSTPLTQTGLPLLGVVLAAGAVAGRRVALRKRT